jgi:hypothetical protein
MEDLFVASLSDVEDVGPKIRNVTPNVVELHKLACADAVVTPDTSAWTLGWLSQLPANWLYEKMEKEWVGTSEEEHWGYVLGTCWHFPDDPARDDKHDGMTVQDFMQAPQATKAGLTMTDVVVLRLYTGPAYKMLNTYMRGITGGKALPDSSPHYPATAHNLDDALLKLIPHNDSTFTLYRGLSGTPSAELKAYYTAEELTSKARPTEMGFMSTTMDSTLATSEFSGEFLYVLHCKPGVVSDPIRGSCYANGANVEWVSQYPMERETLFPSALVLQKVVKVEEVDVKAKIVWHFEPRVPIERGTTVQALSAPAQ